MSNQLTKVLRQLQIEIKSQIDDIVQIYNLKPNIVQNLFDVTKGPISSDHTAAFYISACEESAKNGWYS